MQRLVSPARVLVSKTCVRTFRSLLPKRIILLRHGESIGNKNEEAYESTPDHHISLTSKGKQQAHELGFRLRVLIEKEPILIYCSPYLRTKQTLYYIMRSFTDNHIHDCREEPRLAGEALYTDQHSNCFCFFTFVKCFVGYISLFWLDANVLFNSLLVYRATIW